MHYLIRKRVEVVLSPIIMEFSKLKLPTYLPNLTKLPFILTRARINANECEWEKKYVVAENKHYDQSSAGERKREKH